MPLGKLLPITMGPTSNTFLEVHCKWKQHEEWPQYGKVIAEYIPRGGPTGAPPRKCMMIHMWGKLLFAGRCHRTGDTSSSHYGCHCPLEMVPAHDFAELLRVRV